MSCAESADDAEENLEENGIYLRDLLAREGLKGWEKNLDGVKHGFANCCTFPWQTESCS